MGVAASKRKIPFPPVNGLPVELERHAEPDDGSVVACNLDIAPQVDGILFLGKLSRTVQAQHTLGGQCREMSQGVICSTVGPRRHLAALGGEFV